MCPLLAFLAGALLGGIVERQWIMHKRNDLHARWRAVVESLNGGDQGDDQ